MKAIEIPYPEGKIKEIKREDLQALEKMCHDREVLDLYFENGLKIGNKEYDSPEEYWQDILKVQESERLMSDCFIRNQYRLAIEEQGIKGVFGIDMHPYAIEENNKLFHLAEISYFIAKSFRRTGICERASRAAILYIFENLNVGAICAISLLENTASQRLCEKLGFTKKFQGANPERANGREIVVYQLLPEELASIAS